MAGYIFAAYWFTASPSFANPAVTLARSLTRAFAGIRVDDVPGFVLAQVVGAACALAVASICSTGTRSGDRAARAPGQGQSAVRVSLHLTADPDGT